MSDTNETLKELRELFEMPRHQPMHRMRIAELFARLDNELTNGGRLPDEWADAIRPQLRAPRQNHYCQVCDIVHALPMCVYKSQTMSRYPCSECSESFGSALALADHALAKGH